MNTLTNNDRELISSDLVHRLEPLSLRAKFVVEGFLTGLHRSPYHGFSVEFAEHRMYQPGDPLKHVDWKVFGRTDRFYIKQYQEETNLRGMILLDQSLSMQYSSAKWATKFEYGRSLAAALIYLMLSQRDAVGLTLFDTEIRDFYPAKSALTWRNVLWSCLEQAKTGGKTKVGAALHHLAERVGRRGMVILISDLLDDPDELISGLHHFRHNGYEVIVFQVLDPRELDFAFEREARFEELESGQTMTASPWQMREAYSEEMNTFLEKLRSGCSRHKVSLHTVTTNTPLDKALLEFLTFRQKRM
ncbi:MAG: DUF58 domain-containing protein [Candidatus Electryonea clarkiae]|nr:DUF58 domain-containing protein [Candidatus Electryonea clarkiae]MDP8287953.1 DUF58 domain-containing protein [Candidatus Electryonea clarkiae]